ncbi:molecular chaperone DnaJ [Rhodomicrobium sp. Az07]|uniref:molecular chaperone DnaJ n=1 Tax=Rhodomicrobium sp. Az07 TaxID=2839034 RepID=UPI001BE9137B|nr:molecular chaperone DnaJ [Rhodomicrobium sp. Az07]MBT3071837.1 molecular chaperone DnaJ [Rhodomicrobium sp. Az07]
MVGLGVALYLLGYLSRADMGKLAVYLRKGSVVLVAFGAAFVATRNIGVALLAGMTVWSFMQRTGWFPGKGKIGAGGGTSGVRTPWLDMTLDHRTGAISGRLLKGRFEGKALADLSEAERGEVLAELRANDAEAAKLFEAWLDRVSPDWSAGGGSGNAGSGPSRAMTLDEAYLILGLKSGAKRDDVLAAHRNLMKRFHPDQGGSNYLASQINAAKDVLLKNIKA